MDATPLLRLYARRRARRLAEQDPVRAQERQLLRLVGRARETRFGRDYDFARIRSVADFQQRVPLRRYEDFWEQYWRPAFPRLIDQSWPGTIPYFAATSGTTAGRTKYIPVSRAMVAANRRAALDVLVHHLGHRSDSRVFGGKNFVLGGSTDLVEQAAGIYSGDLSGIAARELPLWARPFYFPPPDLARIADWDEKVEAIGPRSLAEDVRSLAGTASWVLLFLERMMECRGVAGIGGLYPHLELLVHGGVNFAPYRARFEELLRGSRVDLREVYPASEGFIASADRGTGEGLRMMADNGLFLEFVPIDDLGTAHPRRFWLADVEPGVNCALVLSSCAGLWAYVLGDTVRVVDRHPPRLVVTGRTSYFLSAFGEHLIGDEIERAVTGAAAAIGARLNDFSVGPVFPETSGERGSHLYVAEFTETPPPDRLMDFAAAIDDALQAMNADYRDHRQPDFGIAPPRVLVAPPGTFAAWMRSRGRLGGQNKVPRVINDTDLFQGLRAFVEETREKGLP